MSAAEVAAVLLSGHLYLGPQLGGDIPAGCSCHEWTANHFRSDQRPTDQHHFHVAQIIVAALTTTSVDAFHIAHQREWSTATFGPADSRGPHGPLAHLRKEVEEVADDPYALEEWVDCIILALDGAWRAGHEPQQIIDAIKAKQAKNEARTWPDWRGVPADQAIEHVRTAAKETP